MLKSFIPSVEYLGVNSGNWSHENVGTRWQQAVNRLNLPSYQFSVRGGLSRQDENEIDQLPCGVYNWHYRDVIGAPSPTELTLVPSRTSSYTAHAVLLPSLHYEPFAFCAYGLTQLRSIFEPHRYYSSPNLQYPSTVLKFCLSSLYCSRLSNQPFASVPKRITNAMA